MVLLESPPASEPGADATRSKKLLRRAFSTQLRRSWSDLVRGRRRPRTAQHLDRLRDLRHVEATFSRGCPDAHPDAAAGDGLESLEAELELVAGRQVEIW
jgi:hypothetical protein